MKVLWLCNIMLPQICKELGVEGSKKEGWISGLLNSILQSDKEVEIAVAFPVSLQFLTEGRSWIKGSFMPEEGKKELTYYGFLEDTLQPWKYDEKLEDIMKEIILDAGADLLHSFGTEYPHTLAAVKAFSQPKRTLIGIQGLCSVYADAYYANIPQKVRKRITFRDRLRKDSLMQQKEKFVKRGEFEKEAIGLSGHIAGRTQWDRKYAGEFSPNGTYHVLRETLRKEFYTGGWNYEQCEKHSIFVSQGNYPIKGLHYVLLAMPELLKNYPDTKVYVAGDCILRDGLLGPLKISSYGKYLQDLIRKGKLEEKVIFLGGLSAQAMKEQYLKSHLYLCPSSIENSPNSLGEAMLLRTPVVTADVGGIPSMIDEDECALYHGFSQEKAGEEQRIAAQIVENVSRVFAMEEKVKDLTEKARKHGEKNHSGQDNVQQLFAVYEEICQEGTKEQ